MDDYKKYLAQQLLTEDKLVTYRLLSRALNIHVNTAKEMLYEFHKWQNDKKPGSLHATYLVYGTMKRADEQQDGDVEMSGTQTSEDDHAPFSEQVPPQTLSLVKEEQLQEALAQYDEVTSIHVYSLAPHPLKDLQLLADTARQLLEISSLDDATTSAKTYGSIRNPNMRKRERRGQGSKPIPRAPVSAPKTEAKTQVKQEANPASTSTSTKEEAKAAQPAKPKESVAPSAAKKSSAAASMKRQGASGIGQMFAKAASKAKKPAAATSPNDSKASSAAVSPTAEESSMAMSDDGEDDAEPTADVKREDSVSRQTRKDRQADLRRMMEESDEEETESKADTPAEEPMEEDEPPAPEPEPEPEEPAEMVSSTGDGRRRGRRRVMRKKQVMDEEGYLVTVQEAGWESFSEEEAPPPPKPAAKPAATTQSTAKAKAKKPAGKGGQGNIMSFFGKK